MVVFLLAALFAQGVSGLFANDEIFNTGPLYGYVSDGTSLALTPGIGACSTGSWSRLPCT